MSLLTQSEVYAALAAAESGGERLAVATIITTSGSTPQRTGAKLLVYEDGRMAGTVGGGFTLRDAPDVPPDEEGMICGGEMEVLIEVW
jgi:xanthine dehydrogenase accessory factor